MLLEFVRSVIEDAIDPGPVWKGYVDLGWTELSEPARRYARSFSGTIAGGTSEIQRNIIAQRVLGLPHG